MNKQLTEQELNSIRGSIQEFNSLKMQLADTVMHQQILTKKIEEVRIAYSQMEKALIETYGENASINIDTGEITEKAPQAVGNRDGFMGVVK